MVKIAQDALQVGSSGHRAKAGGKYPAIDCYPAGKFGGKTT
jgi:hypothetical protein